MDTIISKSKNFKVEIQPLETTDKIYKRSIKVMDKNNNIIHEYIQKYGSSPLNRFVTINGTEWWIGGREYMLRLFVNCEKGQVFDDPDKRELSKSYKGGTEFIWAGDVRISPNGNYLMVVGCMWSFPYEWRLYDIHNMVKNVTNNSLESNDYENNDESDSFMVREVSLYKHLRDKEELKEDDPRYEADENPLSDDEIFTYEFVKDNEITIKYRDGKEWKYFNTIDLVAYE